MSESNDDMFGRRHFEAFISAPPFDHMCDRYRPDSARPGQYKRYETQIAWEAWQAAVALGRASMSPMMRAPEDEACSSQPGGVLDNRPILNKDTPDDRA